MTALTFVPEEWAELVPEELCVAEPPWEVSGEPVYCQLTEGHGGRHYNRDLKVFWHGSE